ncbi:uncharacterized protein LOC117781495 [Drosophila innubila]|uniref:uncharacterized protein LOC117781495 n=1 Tax=Drosophila innubila TaxID=198719 RepID=UPI00148CFF54|nr:uncharacterized protein LOC117781495 [Drosophila innubila]
MSRISKLRALKHLDCLDIPSSSIDELFKTQLEKICTRNLEQINILRLVKECSSLKDLTCHCNYIDEKFLPLLLDSLKARGFQPDRPFELNMTTSIQFKNILLTQLGSIPKSNLLNMQLSYSDTIEEVEEVVEEIEDEIEDEIEEEIEEMYF